ncbi:MAG: hypothetical protein E2O83_02255 [Bacteroidetes bacterium]|nr:MAG: hypothetical protein E2O83_02255 [Bacteroidota bacterium]
MKNKLENIDKLIKESLTQEEAAFYAELDEQNPFEMLEGLFHGRNRWIIILINVILLIFFGLFIYCLIQFLNAEATNDLILWAASGFASFAIVGFLKLFTWMQMDKNAILREIKRLELQVSSLAGKMS